MLPPDAAVSLQQSRARTARPVAAPQVNDFDLARKANSAGQAQARQAEINKAARQKALAVAQPKVATAVAKPVARIALTSDGGGGGTAKTAVAAADPGNTETTATLVPDFTSDQAYVDAKNSGSLALDDYDANTLLGRQQADATHDYQTGLLKLAMNDQRNSTAEDYAARGIIRSGAYLGAQDLVDTAGVQQQAAIDQDVTDYITDRDQGRLGVQGDNRDKLNGVLAQLQSAFYGAQRKAG